MTKTYFINLYMKFHFQNLGSLPYKRLFFCGSRGERKGSGPPGNSQMAKGFLRNDGTDHPPNPLKKQLDYGMVQLLLEGDSYGPLRKIVDDYVIVIPWVVRLYVEMIHEL